MCSLCTTWGCSTLELQCFKPRAQHSGATLICSHAAACWCCPGGPPTSSADSGSPGLHVWLHLFSAGSLDFGPRGSGPKAILARSRWCCTSKACSTPGRSRRGKLRAKPHQPVGSRPRRSIHAFPRPGCSRQPAAPISSGRCLSRCRGCSQTSGLGHSTKAQTTPQQPLVQHQVETHFQSWQDFFSQHSSWVLPNRPRPPITAPALASF